MSKAQEDKLVAHRPGFPSSGELMTLNISQKAWLQITQMLKMLGKLMFPTSLNSSQVIWM